MSQDEFTKLFKYLEEFRAEVNKRFEQNEHDHANVLAAVAELGSHLKDYHQELLLLAHKVDRLERWIQQVAQVTGVKLEY
jgi:ABC-type transporter Mla subunit MlaD